MSRTPNYVPVTVERVDYYVRSSVLGGRVITELKGGGQKAKTHVYAGSEVIAEQDVYAGGAQGLTWKQSNPVTGTSVEQNTANGQTQKQEYDPFGLELGDSDPYLNNAEPDYASLSGGSFYRSGGNPFDDQGGCTIDRMAASCSQARFLLGAGVAQQCPDNDCGPRVQTITTIGQGGRVIGSDSRIILPGQTGWDGSLDGRYRQDEILRKGIPYVQLGWRIFNRVSGGGNSPYVQIAALGHVPGLFAGLPQNIRPLTPEEIAEQRRLLVNTLDNSLRSILCRGFVSALLTELGAVTGVAPYSNDPVAIFDRIASLPNAMRATDEAGVMGRAGGSAGAGTATYILNLANMATLRTGNASRVHELVHAAPNNASIPWYSHLNMNQAAFNVLSRGGSDAAKLFGDGTGTFDRTANNGDGTNYAGWALDSFCR